MKLSGEKEISMYHRFSPSRRRFALPILGLAMALAGCDSDTSVTAPDPIFASGNGIAVQSSSTATDGSDPGAVRVQLRMDVVSGLNALRQAATNGLAQVRVCQAGACEARLLSTQSWEGSCAGVEPLALVTAWLEGDKVGLDFCIPVLQEQQVYETAVGDGNGESNVVQTVCSPTAVGTACLSR